MKNRWNIVKRIGLALVVIVLALAGFRLLVATKPVNQKKDRTIRATPVEVQALTIKDHKINIVAHGSVVPAVEVQIRPEVPGRIVQIHPQLVSGGRLRKGEILLRIDPRDYELDLAQKKAQLIQAQAALQQELGRQNVAQVEWDLYRKEENSQAHPSGLALRRPQLLAAQAQLESSRIAVARADLARKRCTLRSPFNALVLSESIDVGQWISSQTAIATLVDSDQYWVELSIRPEQIQFVRFQRSKTDPGSKAVIVLETGKQSVNWKGQVIRLLGSLDPIGRMARVVVSVENPLAEHPLLLGSYVTVQIQGDSLPDVIEVPRRALYQGDKLLIAQSNGKLAIRKADVIWRNRSSVLVRQDDLVGQLLVTSPLSRPVSGMEVQQNLSVQP